MGMPIVVVRDVDDQAALEPLFDWFRWVDATFSTYVADSEISRIDRGELTPADAHPHVREILARCDELRVETDGFFDVRAHGRFDLDPSGLVKGWSVDRAAAIADDLGWRNYAISAGGTSVSGEGPAWSARLRGYEALTIVDDGRSLRTPGFGRST